MDKQGSILSKHLILVSGFTLLLAITFSFFSIDILRYYKVSEAYLPLAATYLKIGLANMVLQAIYGGLDGMLVGSSKQKISMFIAAFLVIGNIICNYYAIHYFYSGLPDQASVYLPAVTMGVSTTIMILLAVLFAYAIISRNVQGRVNITFSEVLPVWWSELGTYLIRGLVPFIYAYQLNFAITNFRLLTSYQLALHIAYIFCFPLTGAMQIAIRDTSSSGAINNSSGPPLWWSTFLYTGLLPTTALLLVGGIFSAQLMKIFYGYEVPVDHSAMIFLLFFSSWVGQLGNTMTIPLRAAKKSYFVTKNFFIAELCVMLGGTQLLVIYNKATPTLLGYIIVLFSTAFFVFNARDVYLMFSRKLPELIYEKNI